jgi:hypothetical protein
MDRVAHHLMAVVIWECHREVHRPTRELPFPVGQTRPGASPPGSATPSAPQGRTGLDAYIKKLWSIEAANDPNAHTPGSQYRGLNQLSPGEERKYGINDNNWRNPDAQYKAAVGKATNDAAEFTKIMGREPTPGELYLVHNQGIGGAANHLNNPTGLAWQNMYATAEGRQKGEAWAARAIQGNIPKSLRDQGYNWRNIDSGTFANGWTSRFGLPQMAALGLGNTPQQDQPPALPTANSPVADKGVIQPPTTIGSIKAPQNTPANDKDEEGYKVIPPEGTTLKPIQVADNKSIGATSPAMPSTPDPEIEQGGSPPGYGPGPMPPVPYAPSAKQFSDLYGMMLRQGDREGAQKLLEEYRKQLQPYDTKTPQGRLITAPTPGGGGISQFMPGEIQEVPMGKYHFKAIPYINPKTNQTEYQYLIPGGGTNGGSGLGSADEAMKKVREWDAMEHGAQTRMTGAMTERNKLVGQSIDAPGIIRNLDVMQAQLSRAQMLRGPGGPLALELSQLVDSISPGASKAMGLSKEASSSEIFNKINAFLATQTTQSLSARGTNFQLQTFMRTHPSLMNTYEGSKILIDLLKQEFQIRQNVGSRLWKLDESNVNQMPDIIKDEYDKAPPVMHLPEGDFYMKHFNSKEDLQQHGLKKGDMFLSKKDEMKVVP